MNLLSAHLFKAGSDRGEPLDLSQHHHREGLPFLETTDRMMQRLLELERLLSEIRGEIGAVHGRLDRLERAITAFKRQGP